MNELLQKHGCANVFNVPEGLRELMSDITREVLREQPKKIYNFIANYLSVLLITREHGILSVRILEDLCDCRASVCEHLISHGIPREQAESIANVIKENIEAFEHVEGNETLREAEIVKKVLAKQVLDEDTIATVCQITRNAYREYWYRKKLLEKDVKTKPDQPWEVAAEHTLAIYKKTKPSFSELKRATEKITAAYRGYHVRKNLLRHFKPQKPHGPILDQPGPPLDLAASREINLGPLVELQPLMDNVSVLFKEHNVICHNVDVSQNTMSVTHILKDENYLHSQLSIGRGHKRVSYNVDRTAKMCSLGDMYSAVGATAPKKSHASSIDVGSKRGLRLASGLKISFSSDPVEVIPYSYDGEDNEIDEDIKSVADTGDPEGSEIPEDIHPAEPAEIPEAEVAEVPEELPQ